MPLVALHECLSSKPGGSWHQLQAEITVQLELQPLKGTDTLKAAHTAFASRVRRPRLSSLTEASEGHSFDDQLFVKGEALTGHSRLPLASPALSYQLTTSATAWSGHRPLSPMSRVFLLRSGQKRQ